MLAVMRQSCLVSKAIAQRAHRDFRSYWLLGDLPEAHGRRHSGRAAAATEGWARVAASLLEAERRTAMRWQGIADARDVAGMEEDMEEVATVAVAAGELVAGIARAREQA